jgi:glycosyltransferase involved in cell wall biosynthesis
MTAVDVLLPVRYPAPWLDAALAGLANQDFSDWRLVVVIHGEDQGISRQVRDSGLTADIYSVAENVAFAEALNLGLAHCTAPFVARLDSDDVPLASRLRLQRECLEENPASVLVVSPAVVMDRDGSYHSVRTVPVTSTEVIRSLAWKNCIIHPAVMFRREPVVEAGGYSKLAQHTEDYDLWLRLLATHDVCVCPSPVTSTKVIRKQARARILKSRLAFARARGIPQPIAWGQHALWSFRQVLRGW